MTKKNVYSSMLAITLAAGLNFPLCHAESLPLWEVGAGVGAISLPDYRGSDVMKTYVLPIPYLVYRGEYFKADRNGVRGTLFDNDKVEVNISLNATQPANSTGNKARSGMADLKPTIELGSTVDVNLLRSPDQRMKLDVRLPVRTSITVESSPRQIGWLVLPSLNLDVKDPANFPDWNLGLVAGLVFNNRQYNAHFYSVSPSEATAERAAYSAPGGYSGAQFTMALSKRYPRYWVGGFMRCDTVAGAAFGDSPLVKKRSAISAGIAISWIFNESNYKVVDDGK